MAISFPDESQFGSDYTEKLTMMITPQMSKALEQLSDVLGKDRSKTVRWCLEQVLKEAIEQGKITAPKSK